MKKAIRSLDRFDIYLIAAAMAWLAMLFLVSCSTVQPVIDQAQDTNKACIDSGGSMQFDPSALAFKCIHPVVEPKPEPEIIDVPPEPEPDPVIINVPPLPDYADCRLLNPGEFISITPPTGKTASGEIAFTIQGLNADSFPTVDGWLAGIVGRNKFKGEQNLQLHIYKNGSAGDVRLISQSFKDKTCLRQNATHCESADIWRGLVFDPAKIYHVRIFWNPRKASMEISTTGDQVLVWGGQNETPVWGGFASIEYIRVGNGNIFPGRPGQSTPITVCVGG